MRMVELAEAQSRLGQLVESLTPGDEIVIEKNHKLVARLHPADSSRHPRPLREFAGKFRPLPQAEQDDLKLHDKDWCDPNIRNGKVSEAIAQDEHFARANIVLP